jgi:hypothetical protein
MHKSRSKRLGIRKRIGFLLAKAYSLKPAAYSLGF